MWAHRGARLQPSKAPFPSPLLSCAHTRGHRQGHTRTRGHVSTPGHAHRQGYEHNHAHAGKGARAQAQTCTSVHGQGMSARGTRALRPESTRFRAPRTLAPSPPSAPHPGSQRPAPPAPGLPASCAHSLGAGAGAPGPRARILQAAPESGRAAAWRLPAPGKSPAGPSEDVGGRQLSRRRRCPAGVPPGPRRLGVPGKVGRREARKDAAATSASTPQSGVRRREQKPGERAHGPPAPLHLTRISLPSPTSGRSSGEEAKASQPSPGSAEQKRPRRGWGRGSCRLRLRYLPFG